MIALLTAVVLNRTVAGRGFFRSVFYREYYRKTGLSDEMGIFCWTDSECLTIVSLARRVDEPAFTRAEIGRISGYFPIIAATIIAALAHREAEGTCIFATFGRERPLSHSRSVTRKTRYVALAARPS